MKSLLVALILAIIPLQATCSDITYEGKYPHYKDHPLDLIALFIPENPIIFEAGGHWGDDTVRFAEKWPKCTIHSFEPNPHAYEILCNATKHLSNVKTYPLAIANYNGTALFNVCHGSYGNDPRFEGASSLLEANESMQQHYQGPKVEVRCQTLDSWCQENKVDHFDFMWMDMEGFELQALRAASKTLANVKVIYVETNFQQFRKGMTKYHQLKAFLVTQGFEMVHHLYQLGFQGNAIFVKRCSKLD